MNLYQYTTEIQILNYLIIYKVLNIFTNNKVNLLALLNITNNSFNFNRKYSNTPAAYIR